MNSIFFCSYMFILNIVFIFFNLIIFKNLIVTLSLKKEFRVISSYRKFKSNELFQLAKIMFDKGFINQSYLLFSLCNTLTDRKDVVSKSVLCFYLGQIKYKTNNFNLAIFFLRKALNTFPGLNSARYLLIQIYYKKRLFYKLTKQAALNYYSYQDSTRDVNTILEKLNRDDRI